MLGELTTKQVQFCDHYLASLNAADAARRAGYPPRYADRIGWENLRKPVIAARIETGLAEQRKAEEIRREHVIDELMRIVRTNIADYIRIDEDGEIHVNFEAVTRDQTAGLVHCQVDEFTRGRGKRKHTVRRIHIRLADKIAAFKLLGPMLGLWKDGRRTRRRR